jgi:hypothetical protein
MDQTLTSEQNRLAAGWEILVCYKNAPDIPSLKGLDTKTNRLAVNRQS